ncbi:C4-dicarboxylate ABC transporter [Gordonia crocea]|uniref:C4-dicarboxylate ABC transporter n=1 Tax=Gordonia crocea TaxID=589162 RepID=A0A7I9V1L5_9ACTN|nr:C4-dicarboxylate ABC transporter [Gordonia crocea]
MQTRPRTRFPAHQVASASQAVAFITPNWFASVMGTGVVAVASVMLPVHFPGQRVLALGFWALATAILLVVTAATGAHWVRHRAVARSHHRHPVMTHFYGAPAMAFLTVGAGAQLVGVDIIGQRASLAVNAVFWTVGTVLGLSTAVAVPVLLFTRIEVDDDAAFGGWLMPVVPPMVSAATGALLVPHLPSGQWQMTLLWGCYAMFGLSLIASLVIIPLIWGRLAHRGVGAAVMVPTLWIVLGPLGQSITAANQLGGVAGAVDPAYARALAVGGVLYGVPVAGFALLWASIAATLTVGAARRRLPFGLTWWSFTFPVGTCVTGLSALATHTGALAFTGAAVVAYLGLLAAWGIVAGRTAHGVVVTGSLLVPSASR